MSTQSDPSPQNLRDAEAVFKKAVQGTVTAGLSVPSIEKYQELVKELDKLYVGSSPAHLHI